MVIVYQKCVLRKFNYLIKPTRLTNINVESVQSWIPSVISNKEMADANVEFPEKHFLYFYIMT